MDRCGHGEDVGTIPQQSVHLRRERNLPWSCVGYGGMHATALSPSCEGPLHQGVTEPLHQGVTEPLHQGVTEPLHQGITEPLHQGVTGISVYRLCLDSIPALKTPKI